MFAGDYKKTNELFKLICSKLQSNVRPEACKGYGISNEKEKIIEEYNKQWGEKGSMERSIINYDHVKEKYN